MDLSLSKSNDQPIDLSKKSTCVVGSPAVKRKRSQLNRPLIIKYQAITRVANGESRWEVAKDMNIAESTLRGWVKAEDSIRKAVEASCSSPTFSSDGSDKENQQHHINQNETTSRLSVDSRRISKVARRTNRSNSQSSNSSSFYDNNNSLNSLNHNNSAVLDNTTDKMYKSTTEGAAAAATTTTAEYQKSEKTLEYWQQYLWLWLDHERQLLQREIIPLVLSDGEDSV